MFLNPHQNLRFSPSFFGLNHVQVHFVTIKVSVVRCTDGQIESERLSFHDTNFMNHHRHSV